jgi:tetratricopeptide (TPR) repeat protein
MKSPLKATSPIVLVSLGWLAISAWSSFVVQPQIVSRYQEKSNAALQAANIIDADGNVLDLTHWLKKEAPETLADKRRLLNDASLYLRRLIDVSPDVSRLILQLAATADASAQLHSRLAYQATKDGDEIQAETYRRKAFTDSELAQDMMVRLSRQDNAEAQVAKAWELARELRSPVRTQDRIEQLVVNALEVLERAPASRVGLARLGQLRTLQAYAIEERSLLEERTRFIQEAVELLSRIDSPSLVEQAFLAEAQDALHPEQAIQTSIAASQGFLGEQADEKQSPEEIALFFSCLARLGSLQEAQSAVVSKLPGLSHQDQLACRGLCAEYCVRRVICESNFPSAARQFASVDALVLAIRLDPQSASLLKLVERMVVQREDDALSLGLFEQLTNERYATLRHLILAVRGAIENDWVGSRNEIRQSLEKEAGLSSAAVSIISHLVDSQLISVDTATQFLDNTMEISPDDPSLSFTSAIFFEKQNKLEKAAGCLEKILVKTANDPQILAFLGNIYARLDRREDQKRIQLELQKARKRN